MTTRLFRNSLGNRCLIGFAVVSALMAAGRPVGSAETVGDVPTRYIVTPQQFGAKADGVTDDTAAIQKAINTVFERGGGTVFFPRGVYVLSKPPVTRDLRGNNPNSQIDIPSRDAARLSEDGTKIANLDEHNAQGGISLVGECVPLSTVGQYAIHQTDPKQVQLAKLAVAPFAGAVLYSTYTHPHPDGTPAAILGFSVPQGSTFGFASGQTELKNLTFRAHASKEQGYPTLSGVNVQCARSIVMTNVNVDVDLPLPMLKAPRCDTAGILFPKVNCELSYFTNLGVYGFKYGYIFGEHGNGDAICAATCTHAFAFSGGHHLICLGLLSAQNCRHQLSSLPKAVLGHPPGRAFLKIAAMDIERNPGQQPYDFNYANFVNDPDNYLCGSMTYHIVTSRVGADNGSFVQKGGAHLTCTPSYREGKR
ncbi:MAG: glycosyl hydrolase family 28-related protein [Thermoguttaceae bacterium]